ncbi:hypothetical protein [Hyalangium rubrum]|uniref:Lipoprotein n=1 Tax=Hyalangium rubrum TaxID=3103134 RepID=A0ABU5GWV5_9BACT|nr:hypothetical protein [Hyalangium sp. s54d21]MDY7225675.1 hypothetical protein [Hyalangium sp. s54d21]
MMSARPSRGTRGLLFHAFLSAVAAGALGCASASVFAHHSPMHPSSAEPVTFKAVATGDIDRVILSYERFTLSESATGDLVQVLDGPPVEVKTCQASGVKSLECMHTMTSAFPDNSLITFTAKVIDTGGGSEMEAYSFAAGEYPLRTAPIPIRLKGGTAEKLDVIFIRDTDIAEASFRSELENLIQGTYFRYSEIKTWRGLYNFYYSKWDGDYEADCLFTAPGNFAELDVFGDALVLLHQAELRDCRAGKWMSSEIQYDKSILHESGHVLFNLQDEYCCDSFYSLQSCNQNLWSSLADCQAEASKLKYPAASCTQLSSDQGTLALWRIDPATSAQGCIMGPSQHSDGSTFGKACARRIHFRYEQCTQGECFPSPECP